MKAVKEAELRSVSHCAGNEKLCSGHATCGLVQGSHHEQQKYRMVNSDCFGSTAHHVPQVLLVSSRGRKHYATDTVRSARLQALGSGHVSNCRDAVGFDFDLHYLRAFRGNCRVARRCAIPCELCRSVAAGKMAWLCYFPAATFCGACSGHGVTSRLRFPIHFCL